MQGKRTSHEFLILMRAGSFLRVPRRTFRGFVLLLLHYSAHMDGAVHVLFFRNGGGFPVLVGLTALGMGFL